jgi:ribonucleotide monophosphatase NagD (HAD superfamily)
MESMKTPGSAKQAATSVTVTVTAAAQTQTPMQTQTQLMMVTNNSTMTMNTTTTTMSKTNNNKHANDTKVSPVTMYFRNIENEKEENDALIAENDILSGDRTDEEANCCFGLDQEVVSGLLGLTEIDAP